MLIHRIAPHVTPCLRATPFPVAARKSLLTESSATPDVQRLSPAISMRYFVCFSSPELHGMRLATSSRRAALASGGFIVKTRIQSLSFLATLAIALLCWGSALNARNTPSTTPDRQAQQPSSSPDTTPQQSTPDTQQPPDQAPPQSGAQQSQSGSSADSGAASGTQTFSGTVAKQG